MDSNKLSAIDKALAAAKARKAAKAAAPTAEAPKRAGKVVSDEDKAKAAAEREAKAAQLAQERAERKAKRDAERAQKLAEKAAARQPAHMRKVQKAAEKLGTLNETAQLLYNDATTNLTAAQLASLALHLQHFNRVKATERALSQKIEEGQVVEVVGGSDPRLIGQVGAVVKAQRIRCYVDLGGSKPAYLFTSDVQVVDVPAELTQETSETTTEATTEVPEAVNA